MEIREISGIVISVKSDSVFKVCYLKFLTESKVETVKVSTSREESKFQNFFDPTYIITIEIVKTRKNWILKQVLSSRKIHPVTDYSKMLKLASMFKLVDKNLTESQETEILYWLVNQIKYEFKGNSEREFEDELQSRLDFSIAG